MGGVTALIFLVVILLATQAVEAQAVDVRNVRDVLKADYIYLSSLVGSDGSVVEPYNSLRSQALVGSMAGWLHIGLGDTESLMLLDKVADAVNSRVEREDGVDLGFDGGVQDGENLITHLTVADLLSIHYGLTKDPRSRANLLRLLESVEKKIGWTPPTSKAAILARASSLSFLAGGQPLKEDVSEALDEYARRIYDIINYSAVGYEKLTSSLKQLSLLMEAAREAGLEPPAELVALWSVHVDYVVEATQTLPISSEGYRKLLRGFSSLVDAAANTHLNASKVAAEQAVRTAEAIDGIWRAGDRILYLPVDPLEVYPLDPLTPADRIVADQAAGRTVLMADLRFPILILTLEQAVGERPDLHEAVTLAISRVSVKDGYFPLIERGLIKSEELVNRWLRIQLLSTYLALQRAPSVQQRGETLQLFLGTHPTFLAILTMLLTIAILRRVGALRW
ncbi:hypothetical protein HRbin01_01416 [archaeon HR01]|nr:hypothetical protein HRbin01_01416 [archaeon HR01]